MINYTNNLTINRKLWVPFTINDFFETKADYFCNDVIKDKKGCKY